MTPPVVLNIRLLPGLVQSKDHKLEIPVRQSLADVLPMPNEPQHLPVVEMRRMRPPWLMTLFQIETIDSWSLNIQNRI